jgi:hypothetical protein
VAVLEVEIIKLLPQLHLEYLVKVMLVVVQMVVAVVQELLD